MIARSLCSLVGLSAILTNSAFNYKFKVVEARNSASGKPVLGSQPLPCEIERDVGRAYRDCATASEVTPKQQENALDKYREAMKKIGRPITGTSLANIGSEGCFADKLADPSRGPSKRKERTSNHATASTSSDEYSESEDDVSSWSRRLLISMPHCVPLARSIECSLPVVFLSCSA